jgi:predicted transcriptional regulator
MNNLNRNELEALRVLWETGESKPADIEERFDWTIDNGTLRSVLLGLVEKGLVSRRKQGKAYLYKAEKTRSGLLSSMSRQLARVFAGGSTAGLIAQLLETEKLSPEEVATLRRIAEGRKPSGTKRSDGGKGR